MRIALCARLKIMLSLAPYNRVGASKQTNYCGFWCIVSCVIMIISGQFQNSNRVVKKKIYCVSDSSLRALKESAITCTVQTSIRVEKNELNHFSVEMSKCVTGSRQAQEVEEGRSDDLRRVRGVGPGSVLPREGGEPGDAAEGALGVLGRDLVLASVLARVGVVRR